MGTLSYGYQIGIHIQKRSLDYGDRLLMCFLYNRGYYPNMKSLLKRGHMK